MSDVCSLSILFENYRERLRTSNYDSSSIWNLRVITAFILIRKKKNVEISSSHSKTKQIYRYSPYKVFGRKKRNKKVSSLWFKLKIPFVFRFRDIQNLLRTLQIYDVYHFEVFFNSKYDRGESRVYLNFCHLQLVRYSFDRVATQLPWNFLVVSTRVFAYSLERFHPPCSDVDIFSYFSPELRNSKLKPRETFNQSQGWNRGFYSIVLPCSDIARPWYVYSEIIKIIAHGTTHHFVRSLEIQRSTLFL